jgi:hypothetical protein
MKALTFSAGEQPYKVFGLSLFDLLKLDYDTFQLIDDKTVEVLERKLKAMPKNARGKPISVADNIFNV